MDTAPFELTPEQKGMLASLSRQTGRSIPALIAEALEELQEHVHSQQDNAASHPPGFTGGLAGIGAGTSGCVVPGVVPAVQSLIVLCCVTPSLVFPRHSRLPWSRPWI
jgi:hypothetical protein